MSTHMKILNLVQGSPEWKAIRTDFLCASEAPAMMGADPNFKRSDLLRFKKTRIEREISEWTEKFIFKRGHETEALARVIAERLLGDDLYQLVGITEVDGLKLLASFDGMTAPIYDIHWEHKQFNKELFEIVKAGGDIPPKIYWQLEHQLLVNGNDSCILAVSDGTEANYAQCEYVSRPERRQQLITGWKLFLEELATYEPEEIKAPIVAEAIKDFPPLDIEFASSVVRSNLPAFQANVLDYINRINENLQTDEDFANAKNVAKFLEEKGKYVAQIKRALLDKSQDVSEVMRSLDFLEETINTKRKTLEKLVTTEEKNRKQEVINQATQEWLEFYGQCSASLPAGLKMPHIPCHIAEAAKGRRTLATYKEAARNELNRLKIEASNLKDKILANHQAFMEVAKDHQFLFLDLQDLISKDQDALLAIAKQRIADFKAQQEAKEAEAKARQEAKEAEAKARQEAKEAEAKARQEAAAPEVAPAAPEPAPKAASASVTTYPRQERRTTGLQTSIQFVATRPDYTKSAPTDAAIIRAVATAFSVSYERALSWIEAIDFEAARAPIQPMQNTGA